MSEKQPEYLSYLLRLWRESDSEGADSVESAVWRASLDRPQVGERQGFASLEDLLAYLRRETTLGSVQSECPEEDGQAVQ